MAHGSSDGESNLLLREYYAPIMLGTIIATFLFGVNFTHFMTYLSYRKNDPWLTQGLVAILLTMCALQVSFCIYTLWFFSVENFGNYPVLSSQLWASNIALGVFMAIISVSVQQYFIWRVKMFSQSWLVFGALSLCSISAGALGFVNACTHVSLDHASLKAETAMVHATLAINTFVNVANAALLLYYLLKHQTGFQRSDSVIRRLVITCVESPLLIALLSLVDIITFKATYPTNWTLIVAIPLGQVYTLAILALLNSRAYLRTAWNGVTDINLERTNRIVRFTLSAEEPVRVGVTVEQHAHAEVDPFAPRIKSGRPGCKANSGTMSTGSDIKAHDEHEITWEAEKKIGTVA